MGENFDCKIVWQWDLNTLPKEIRVIFIPSRAEPDLRIEEEKNLNAKLMSVMNLFRVSRHHMRSAISHNVL